MDSAIIFLAHNYMCPLFLMLISVSNFYIRVFFFRCTWQLLYGLILHDVHKQLVISPEFFFQEVSHGLVSVFKKKKKKIKHPK